MRIENPGLGDRFRLGPIPPLVQMWDDGRANSGVKSFGMNGMALEVDDFDRCLNVRRYNNYVNMTNFVTRRPHVERPGRYTDTWGCGARLSTYANPDPPLWGRGFAGPSSHRSPHQTPRFVRCEAWGLA